MTSGETEQPPPEGTGTRERLLDAAQSLLTAVPPVTVLTALLFYFGWARSAAQARRLGFDESVLDMSLRDYFLRSVDSLYLPVATLLGAVLIGSALHTRLTRAVAAGPGPVVVRRLRTARLVACVLIALGFGVAVSGLWRRQEGLVVPLVLAVAIPAVPYLSVLVRRAAGTPDDTGTVQRVLTVLATSGLVTMMLFWWTASFATLVGDHLAVTVARDLARQPPVVVYSAKALGLDATSGVRVATFPGKDVRYPFRYDGLRFLQRSGGRWFLLPDTYDLNRPTVVLVADRDDIRITFGAG